MWFLGGEVRSVRQHRTRKVLEVDRSSGGYRSIRPNYGNSREAATTVTAERRRFGYRSVHVRPKRQGIVMNLKNRSLGDNLIAVVDRLKGLSEATADVFPYANVHSNILHQIRHSRAFVSWRDREPFVRALRDLSSRG
jgi:Transposase, Mutator family